MGDQGCDDLILGDKTAATPELEVILCYPRCPRINFIGSDAVRCPWANHCSQAQLMFWLENKVTSI